MEYNIKIEKPTVAKLSELPKNSSELSDSEKIYLPVDTILTISEILEYKNKHIRVMVSPKNHYLFKKVSAVWLYLNHINTSNLPKDLFDLLPLDKLIQIVGNTTRAKMYHEGLNKTLIEYKINNCVRIAAFLAQVCHESAGFRYAEEIASGQAYEGRKDLGNIYVGDGRKFKGRGLIQLTGRHNYKVCGDALKLDLINFPQKAADPANAPRIAGWFWNSRGLNTLADQNNLSAFKIITRRINGGLNGYKDRLNWWGKAKKILKC